MSAAPPAERPPLQLPAGHHKVLMHSCCAPCSGEVMEALYAAGIDYAVYFYNPNIHPRKEYLLRKEENVRFAKQHNVPFIDADYDTDRWFRLAKGMEDAPERGVRCDMCFSMRFANTAAYAVAHGYTLFTSALGISRWKDMAQINRAGEQAAASHENLAYWTFNWRKGGGAQRMLTISKREQFYQQEYCGCAYSLRDTNRARKARGRDIVRIGTQYYGKGAPGMPGEAAAPGAPTLSASVQEPRPLSVPCSPSAPLDR